MDSKYSAIGGPNSENQNKHGFLKRKKAIVENLMIKKPKVSNGTTSVIEKNNCHEKKGGDQKVEIEKVVKENLQDARKQLPVYMVKARLLEEVKRNDTMILIGETGSGKTTQVPQLIHEMRLEGPGVIAVTQPRRVAAITIALRVANEMNTEVGSIVGYSVRFEDVTSNRTKVKYLTDGMLLREAIVDPLLKKYSFVILDEAHERTVNTDVLFGIVKLAQKERSNQKMHPLKIIIMSATMDVDSFRKYFNNCPVIYLEGRSYPVTIYHSKMKHEDYQYAALCTIFQLHATTPPNHDFLVFLTGQEEIETIMHNIKQIAKETPGPSIRVCPLYAGLPPAKQLQVWKEAPPNTRKIVLATNIAEASVTIPRIKCVIDAGVVKERCPLAPTILLLIAAGMEPSTFPLIDAPPEDSIKASLVLLKELGAIDNETNPKLTVLGKKMSAFPIDPKYSKVLLSAPEYGCLEEALSLVAVLSSENVFHTPMHKREEALKVKQKFISPIGDHITLLNVFKAFCKAPLKKQWCKENYLNHKNLSYACEVRQQLLTVCQRLNLTVSSCGSALDQLLKCLLSGLFTNCAWARGGAGTGGRYVTGSGAAAALHPAGALHAMRPPPPAVLYTELLHTRRPYLVTVSAIQPQWLHQVAPEYARRCRAVR